MRSDRLLVGIALVSVASGCAASRPATSLLERADRLVQQGQYQAGMRAYDELVSTYPTDPGAPRALAARDALGSLLAARGDVARLKEELAARDSELGRLKQELQRLQSETERLRADLEALKKIDLKQERRPR